MRGSGDRALSLPLSDTCMGWPCGQFTQPQQPKSPPHGGLTADGWQAAAPPARNASWDAQLQPQPAPAPGTVPAADPGDLMSAVVGAWAHGCGCGWR